MPGVDTPNLPDARAFASRVEEAKRAHDLDRLIASHYLKVNGGREHPSEREIARVTGEVRRLVDPELVAILAQLLSDEVASE